MVWGSVRNTTGGGEPPLMPTWNPNQVCVSACSVCVSVTAATAAANIQNRFMIPSDRFPEPGPRGPHSAKANSPCRPCATAGIAGFVIILAPGDAE